VVGHFDAISVFGIYLPVVEEIALSSYLPPGSRSPVNGKGGPAKSRPIVKSEFDQSCQTGCYDSVHPEHLSVYNRTALRFFAEGV
jgi:hypothetical protein